jgi:BirA family biotin operon repressor/biotin-[acetyl-CoA-carboxylase] ligase
VEVVLRLLFFEELPSTNDYLKTHPFEPFLGVVALSQTAGRGRRGRRWLSERGKGLYFSVLLPPLNKNLTLAGLAFGHAVYKTLAELSPRFCLKWPNDVYISGKKVAGVLPELLKDRLIVGVGINLFYSKEELSSFPVPATSLTAEGIEFDYQELLSSLHSNVVETYKLLERGEFSVELFEEACPLIGREVRVIEGEKVYNALALGIDREGALIVETPEGIKRLFSAEVSVREVR